MMRYVRLFSIPLSIAIGQTMFQCRYELKTMPCLSAIAVCCRTGYIESWGRGYKRILEAVSAYKLLPPKLEMLSGLMITYYTDIRSQLLAQRVDERYISVVEYAAKNGRVTNSDVQNILGVSKPTASRILQQMNDWLEMQGKVGKGTYYTPKWLTNVSRI